MRKRVDHKDWANIGFDEDKLLSCAILLPLVLIVIGALLSLIGFGKMEFYDLRPDVGVKLVIGVILVSWLLAFALFFYATNR